MLDEGDKVYIHPSDISGAMLCGQRVILQHEPGALKTFGEPIGFGQMLHGMIDDVVSGRKSLTSVKVKASLEKRFAYMIEEDFQVPLELVSSEEKEELFEEVRYAVTTWSNELLESNDKILSDVVVTEQQLEVELGVLLDGRTVILRGTPDLYDPHKIIDWKTASRPWKSEKAQLSIQPPLYRHLVRSNTEYDPQTFMFLVYVRGKGEWQRIVTSRTEQQIETSLAQAWYYANGIYSGTLPATPVSQGAFPERRGWYCNVKWCECWNICPFKYLADNVDESQVKELRWKNG